MSNATLLDDDATAARIFDPQRYVREEKSFDFFVGSSVRLQLNVVPWLARYLDERRLSADQRITPAQDDETFKVTVTISETQQLYWWLRSFGPDLEIVKPASLRRRMAKDVARSAAQYTT